MGGNAVAGEPKPCPFCGSPPIRLQVCEDANEGPFMECMHCGATGPMQESGFVWDDRKDSE